MTKNSHEDINYEVIEQAVWLEHLESINDTTLKERAYPHKYSEATQSAIYKQDYAALLKLLDDEIPIHTKQLPLIAAVLRSLVNPGSSGPKQKLTPKEKLYIHRLVFFEIHRNGISIDKACRNLSADRGLLPNITEELSVSTIKRAFEEIEEKIFNHRHTNFIKWQIEEKNKRDLEQS